MKLPNLEKVKKMKPGGNKLPGPKRFHIKNRFLQKNLLSLIVVAVLAIGTGTAYGTLSSHAVDRGNDPVNGVNKDRYQVLVSGKGYKLSKKQEKDYKLQKKQNQVNAANALQYQSVLRTTTGNRVFRTSSHHFRYTGHTYKSSKNPRVTTNISDQINSLKEPIKAGDSFNIRVSALAYPYKTKNAISADQIKINVEHGNAELYKSKNGSHYYTITLGEGKNKITITATDKKTKKKVTLGPYTIKAGAGSSGGTNTDPTQGTETTPQKKQVKVTGEYVSIPDIEVEEEKTVADVLKEAGVSVEDDIISVPKELLNSDFDKKLEEVLKDKYNKYLEGVGEDETPQEYSDWKDNNEDSVFSSIQWSCSPNLATTLKSSDTITLTCSFPD